MFLIRDPVHVHHFSMKLVIWIITLNPLPHTLNRHLFLSVRSACQLRVYIETAKVTMHDISQPTL